MDFRLLGYPAEINATPRVERAETSSEHPRVGWIWLCIFCEADGMLGEIRDAFYVVSVPEPIAMPAGLVAGGLPLGSCIRERFAGMKRVTS